MDKLNAMRAFAKLAESGSFSTAARLLGRSKAVVSKQVAMLEGALSVQLLVRTTRQVRLTEVGRSYHERCAQVLAELDDLESNVQQSQSSPPTRRAARGRAADLRRVASVGGDPRISAALSRAQGRLGVDRPRCRSGRPRLRRRHPRRPTGRFESARAPPRVELDRHLR